MHRPLRGLLAGALAIGAVALGVAPSASAGEVSPPYVIYGVGTPKTGLPIIARIPGTSQRVQLSERAGLHFLPSASLDGSVVSYITIRNPGPHQKWTTVIRKDGRVIERQPFSLVGGVIPTVSADGSAVVSGGLKGLKAFDVARGTWHALCPECPPMTSVTSASLSPDGTAVAVARKINGNLFVEIRRLADGRRLAIASTGGSTLSGGSAWNSTSDTIAYVYGATGTSSTFATLRTLTIDGVDSPTKFADKTTASGIHHFTSPAWIDGNVWAIESVISAGGTLKLKSQVVTAKDWNSEPVAVGTPLYDGRQLWRSELLFLTAWSEVTPPAARSH